MRTFRSEPYLWVHLAGLAALPIFLELCLVGLAIGDPVFPVWFELFLVAAIGITPVLWMQLQQPFYIFSLVAIALKPQQLTDDQRRCLTLFKSPQNRFLAVGVALLLVLVLRQIYPIAAIATTAVPAVGRLVGLLLAAIAFLGANLFAQVPISVLGVMLTSQADFAATTPELVEKIPQNFTLLGLQVNQILPAIVPDVQPVPVPVSKTTDPAIDPAIAEAIAEAIEAISPEPEPFAATESDATPEN
jgi:hypothetical protein